MTSAPSGALAPRHAPSHLQLALILGGLTALGPLSIDMYLPSFPAIAADLHTTVAQVQVTLATYLGGLAVGQLVYGPLSDRLGRRPPLLAGLALYALAALGCAAAPNLETLAFARFLQALGGCAGIVVSRAVVRDHLAEKESAKLYSSLMLVMGIAPIVAPLLGGQLLRVFGWRAIFVLLAGVGVAQVVLISLTLGESLPKERRSQRTVGETLRAMGGLLGNGHFVRLAVTGGAVQAAMFAYITGSPFVFIELFHVPPERYGLLFGTNAAGLIAASQLNRLLVARFSVVSLLRGSVVIALVAYMGLTLAAWSGAGLPLFLPPLFLGIAMVGLAGPNSTAAAMAPFGKQAGLASAVLGTLQTACGAIASSAVSAFADDTARPMASVMLGCALVAFTLAFLVGSRLTESAAVQSETRG